MTGLVGFASGYAAMKNCDALLMLGTEFPYRAFHPEHARIAQVDVRPEALGNRCSFHLGLLGNVKDTLDAVLPSIEEKTESTHLRDALTAVRLHPRVAHSILDLSDCRGVLSCC
jgi:pyruvate dehydrogenase (quinone)